MRVSPLLVLALLCFGAFAAFATEPSANAGVETERAEVPVTGFQPKARAGAQKFEFQAEVSRLLDILINSLYSSKDIFLRELISNASDAMDKIRFLSLTEPEILGEGETTKLDIKISLDLDNKVLSIRDKGIGMTKQHLIENLGTIAKSGTSSFLEHMQKNGDMNLIGQFGVGFYSVYLVADYVEVISKHNDDKQMIWESAADGNFAVTEDTENEQLGRGTLIKIHLKDEAKEYLESDKLRDLVVKYSQFIQFPIYMYESKEVEETIEQEDEEPVDDSTEDEDEDVTDDEEEEQIDEAPKTIKKKVWDWSLLNDNKAIWLRSPSEVEDDEYNTFYKSLSKDNSEPLAHSHFKAEGDVEFKAILFIPGAAPSDLFDNYYNKGAALKLFVRRVFISDEFDELLPKYLNFVRGIVDSDTLPLNVSRETLQQHSSLKTIKKKLVRKVLDMIRKMADGEGEDAEAAKEGEVAKESSYDKFWKQYGKAIKLGIIEDSSNRIRLAKLMRFQSSASNGKLTSLDEYVARMKEGQKNIYYMAGASIDEVAKSPFLERLVKEGYEVIYFTDPIDEYTMQNLTEFDDFKFSNASKEDMKIGDKDPEAKKAFKAVKEEYKPLTSWWKSLLPQEEVEGVKISARLDTTPCVVVTSKYGWSANMERIMKAQALNDNDKQSYMKGKKTLEINPRHPIIKEMLAKVNSDDEGESVELVAKLLYSTALLESGFVPEDAKAFASGLHQLVRDNLGVSHTAEVDEDVEEVEEVEEVAEPVEAKEPVKDEL